MIEDFKNTVLNIGKKAETLQKVPAFLLGRDNIIVSDGIVLSTGCFDEIRKKTSGPWISYLDVKIPADLWDNIWTNV